MLVERLMESVERYSERIAVADPARQFSYADVLRFADVMRRQVEAATTCDKVGIMMPAAAGFAGVFYGALWAGRTAIPLNFLLQPSELAAVVADSGIDTIFAIRHFEPLLQPLPVRTLFLEDLPLRREMIMQRLRKTPPAPKGSDQNVAVILYTSGTAGVPKGVCLSHANLSRDAEACIELAKLRGEHRFLGVLPLFHAFGLTAMLVVPIGLGATTYYLPRFSPQQAIAAAREQHTSIIMAVASMYGAISRLKDGTPADLASVEYVISGGEALPDAVYDAFKLKYGRPIVQGYGLTETSPVVSLDLPWTHRRGTVGVAIPGVEVAAFDDNGERLEVGRTGELWVKGPVVMQGYYKKPSESAGVLTADGWFKTGDMGDVDAEGYIRITGRKKEMIIVGGDNVYPREVETVLDTHPAVAESAVVGHSDASRGEVVVAFVVLRDGMAAAETELREHCRDGLAGYKVPRKIVIRQDLPRGPTGKLLKRKLKELL